MFDILISIVVYESNLSKVKKLVQSINLENKINIKLIIIDNCSSQQYFNELLKLECTVISAGLNNGYGKSNNHVFNISPLSKYFIILNPDIMLNNDTLFKLFHFMESNSKITMVSPLLRNEKYFYQINRKNFTFINMFFRFILNKKDFLNQDEINNQFKDKNFSLVDRISGSFMMIRSDMFKMIHGFNEVFFMYFEDIELCDRVNKFGITAVTNVTSAYHERQRHSYKKPKFFFIHLSSFIKYKILNIYNKIF